MNDPIALLRDRLHLGGQRRSGRSAEQDGPDAVQLLTAKLLLITGLGSAADALRSGAERDPLATDAARPDEHPVLNARPIKWAPVVLGSAAAIAHAVHAFTPTERSRLATRTLDLGVVGAGLLGFVETLANSRQSGTLPSTNAIALASAGLLGILMDRTERLHEAEQERLERRASLIQRLTPQRRARLDRIVVHV